MHHIKTGLGVSKKSYRYKNRRPIIGPGQGSRATCAACTVITSPLLQTLDKLVKGVKYCDPDKSIQYEAKVKIFVDYATKYINDFEQWLLSKPSPDEVINNLWHNAQTWECSLWTTGGILKLIKCLYYIMMLKFDEDGTAKLIPALELPEMILTSGDSNYSTNIQQYDWSTAHKTLGHWLES